MTKLLEIPESKSFITLEEINMKGIKSRNLVSVYLNESDRIVFANIKDALKTEFPDITDAEVLRVCMRKIAKDEPVIKVVEKVVKPKKHIFSNPYPD